MNCNFIKDALCTFWILLLAGDCMLNLADASSDSIAIGLLITSLSTALVLHRFFRK